MTNVEKSQGGFLTSPLDWFYILQVSAGPPHLQGAFPLWEATLYFLQAFSGILNHSGILRGSFPSLPEGPLYILQANYGLLMLLCYN